MLETGTCTSLVKTRNGQLLWRSLAVAEKLKRGTAQQGHCQARAPQDGRQGAGAQTSEDSQVEYQPTGGRNPTSPD